MRTVILSVFVALTAACGGGVVDATDPKADTLEESSADLKYAAVYRTLYLRGTFNSWKKTSMKLVGDHQWQAEVVLPAGAGAFKFDVAGDWRTSFGDDDGDQIADLGGQNIAVAGGRTVRISFHDESRFYWVEEKTYAATVMLSLPAGVDKQAFVGQVARFGRQGEQAATVGLYAGADHAGPYCPLPGLSKGATYAFSLDLVLGGKRYLAETTFVVDGKNAEFQVPATVTLGSLAAYGTVELTVLADAWQGGALVSSPWGEIDVFLGDWQAGVRAGRTGTDGRLTMMVPGSQQLDAFTMTSSHSVASGSTRVTAVAGSTVRAEIHIAPLSVVIRAHHDCGCGQALYVAGASGYLGDWKEAQKMSYDASTGVWSLQRNLPVGLPFKIVRGPWVDAGSLSTSQVVWERGGDRVVTPPSGYYQSEIDVYPAF